MFLSISLNLISKKLITAILDNMDIQEDINIALFEISIKIILFINATSDTKIDIVKPTPAINDTKNTDNQLILEGFSEILKVQPIKLKSTIPKGFPKQSPKIIP